MKKIAYLLMVAGSALFIQACSSNANKGTSDTSANATADTAAAKPADTTAMAADSGDATFAKKAAIGGMAEVALGKLALSKTSNQKIKDFANMMVTDHGKANAELMTIAKGKHMMLPANVDAEHQAKMDSLSKLSGKDFDNGYVNVMVDGHKKTLDLMQSEASGGKDAELKGFAGKTAPTVKMHLDMITKMQSSMK